MRHEKKRGYTWSLEMTEKMWVLIPEAEGGLLGHKNSCLVLFFDPDFSLEKGKFTFDF